MSRSWDAIGRDREVQTKEGYWNSSTYWRKGQHLQPLIPLTDEKSAQVLRGKVLFEILQILKSWESFPQSWRIGSGSKRRFYRMSRSRDAIGRDRDIQTKSRIIKWSCNPNNHVTLSGLDFYFSSIYYNHVTVGVWVFFESFHKEHKFLFIYQYTPFPFQGKGWGWVVVLFPKHEFE